MAPEVDAGSTPQHYGAKLLSIVVAFLSKR
jgi:hypothetical protein